MDRDEFRTTIGERQQIAVPPGDGARLSGRALVTNDDGIESPGLFALARAVRDAGIEPVVVAPDRDMSGAGTGMGQFDISEGVEFTRADQDGIECYAVAGPPGLAVLTAALGAFGDPPDMVVSGVNAGVNTGHSVIHSGTVGAALTGRTFGRCGIAVSLAPSDPWHWDTAEAAARAVCAWLLDLQRDDVVLNVNVPAVPVDQVRGIRWATLESFGHIRVATTDPSGERVCFELSGDREDTTPGSDHVVLSEGYVTVTALQTVDEVAPLGADLPDL